MKNNTIILLLATILTWLFYDQAIGLNILLTNLLIIAYFYFIRKAGGKKFNVAALWSLATATMAFSYGTVFPFLLNLVCLTILISLAYQPLTSFLAAWLSGLKSLFLGFIKKFDSKLPSFSAGYSVTKVVVLTVPILISLVFLSLYANANPAFKKMLTIDTSFVNMELVVVWGLFGLLAMGLTSYFAWSNILTYDTEKGNEIKRKRRIPVSNPYLLKYEVKAATMGFILLNIILFAFHFADISFFLSGRLPEDVTYSEYVHQGVYALIFSIALAISIILYVFRGNVNFYAKKETILKLTFIWIVQNVLLAFSTLFKNFMYVEIYGLTYKRIGVVVFLSLAILGLITTYFKVGKRKTNYYLLKKNFALGIFLLTLFAAFPWARLITFYNLHYAQTQDLSYILDLPLHNTDLLLEQEQMLQKQHQIELEIRASEIKEKVNEQNWQSINLIDLYVYEKVK